MCLDFVLSLRINKFYFVVIEEFDTNSSSVVSNTCLSVNNFMTIRPSLEMESLLVLVLLYRMEFLVWVWVSALSSFIGSLNKIAAFNL